VAKNLTLLERAYILAGVATEQPRYMEMDDMERVKRGNYKTEYEVMGFRKLRTTYSNSSQLGEILKRAENLTHPAIYRMPDNGGVTKIKGLHVKSSHMGDNPLYSKIVDMMCLDNAEKAATILDTDAVYVTQTKINSKLPGVGESWEWHTDFATWGPLDGIKTNNLLTLMIFIDDVTEENGPVRVIPQSHEIEYSTMKDSSAGYEMLCTPAHDVEMALDRVDGRIETLTGKAGDAYIFHSGLLHSSSVNESDKRRSILFITYNSCYNRPWYFSPNRNYWQHSYNWNNILENR